MRFLLVTVIVVFSFPVFSQLTGVWQGMMIPAGKSYAEGTIFFLEITESGTVRTREEIYGKDAYAVRKGKGDQQEKSIKFAHTGPIEKKKDASGVRWCAMEATLEYIDSTGYLQGSFTSTECRNVLGKIILFRSERKIGTEPVSKELQAWKPGFAEDLKLGRKSVQKREEERKNFRFIPIYFDHDEAVIRPEFEHFLKSMIRVVSGHSDLRIKVTGHTDSDGSDSYNVDLSRRRAEAIIAFFVANGLSKDRIRIEFKGEKDPLGDNKTSEGKQLNRRVDFEFI